MEPCSYLRVDRPRGSNLRPFDCEMASRVKWSAHLQYDKSFIVVVQIIHVPDFHLPPSSVCNLLICHEKVEDWTFETATVSELFNRSVKRWLCVWSDIACMIVGGSEANQCSAGQPQTCPCQEDSWQEEE